MPHRPFPLVGSWRWDVSTHHPELDPTQIPMCAPVGEEKVLYLLDPVGASRRSGVLRLADTLVDAAEVANGEPLADDVALVILSHRPTAEQ